jgi:two-component sensor histidine kinase
VVPSEAAHIFEGRLAALRRAGELRAGDDIARLLEQELTAATDDPSRFSLDGPDIGLHPDWVFALSLLFHELATNAARHGSLSTPDGRVDVCWHLDDGELALTWTESGGPPVRAPSSPGFGSLLVTYAAVKLKGSADLLYFQSGFRCDLRVSLRAVWPRRPGAMFLRNPEGRALPIRAI